ncbi:hypothetical protein Snas_3747 [Stackebrandtia nassauensis DSM 44728]|uniref:Uncharacterized protein n=1 Tax=Stackebrandtia nassauensis (strain DSM 44728 / CIP 108903 / NRRL B-16338 / NBRC 102104 / LLR-40K-21) TaxID=446470 RepID=D3PXS4_STANL|nr:hypothetical protein Snas_3747 [Stackebrandtia nassauensis DSM 44728]
MRCALHAKPWTFDTVADARLLEDRPPAISAADAQGWCDFVVFSPGWLPGDCHVEAVTIRKEAPPGRSDGVTDGRTPWSTINPAALRFEIAGRDRRLRVKQFLYDWAFPALDHPCLWNSATTPHPLPDGAILWRGTDYMGRDGASARLSRTMIEASVMAGSFTDAELVDLYGGLAPVSAEAADRIRDTGFGELTYWARHPGAPAVSVPVGMWKLRRAAEDGPGRWSGDTTAIRAEYGLPQTLAGYRPDAAARFETPTGAIEVELSYTVRPQRDRELRLIVQRSGAGRLEIPPQPEPHPARREIVEVAGTSVHLAWVDERYGPFDAVWRDDASGTDRKLLSSTGSDMNREFVTNALAELLDG